MQFWTIFGWDGNVTLKEFLAVLAKLLSELQGFE